MRSVVGLHELDEVLSGGGQIAEIIAQKIEQIAPKWGVEVSRVEIANVEIHENMQRAIAQKAEATREQAARLIKADAEYQAAQKLAEAARLIAQTPEALELRRMQMLTEREEEKDHTGGISMSSLNQIDHIVVLMLENRSFDSLLGRLYPKSDQFDGLAGNEKNLDSAGADVSVWNLSGTDSRAMTIPVPDPGELWTDVNMQLFGSSKAPIPGAKPDMSGFVKNYQGQSDHSGGYAPNNVMHYYAPEQVPVLSQLAQQFAVSDRWHASAPCQTWPNRFFVHTGTANGYENNSPPRFPYEMPTIFNRFEDCKVPNGWKIYFHDIPQTLTLAKLWLHLDHFRFYDEFRADARQGTLPGYSFIEPRYFADVHLPNDMHPPHSVTLGEQLIADVYNCLRGGSKWAKTLLVITFDEHGGCYDHVPPPAAAPPSSTTTEPFNFDRYGVRVPAVIVSPLIRPGTVLRPPDILPYDHTSILATLRKRFTLGAPLSGRDAVAPDLENALTLPVADNMGPEQLQPLPYVPLPSEVALVKTIPLNGMQKNLLFLAHHLPANADVDAIEAHLASLRANAAATPEDVEENAAKAAGNLTQALAIARSRLERLFGSL